MKKLPLILFFCFVKTLAFANTKTDTIYYLIDTAQTPANDRMWDIHEEYPSLKLYAIKCPCLQFGNQPTFVDNLGANKEEIINQDALKVIKLATLSSVIAKAKDCISSAGKTKKSYAFFLIEPLDKKYVVHKVRLLIPTKPPKTNVDYITIPADDSTRRKKQ